MKVNLPTQSDYTPESVCVRVFVCSCVRVCACVRVCVRYERQSSDDAWAWTIV